MSNVNRGVLVSELHWIKFTDTGKWSFYHYCDGVDRVWEHDEDGFVAVAVDHRIDGYCIQGEEDRWKINMLDPTTGAAWPITWTAGRRSSPA